MPFKAVSTLKHSVTLIHCVGAALTAQSSAATVQLHWSRLRVFFYSLLMTNDDTVCAEY